MRPHGWAAQGEIVAEFTALLFYDNLALQFPVSVTSVIWHRVPYGLLDQSSSILFSSPNARIPSTTATSIAPRRALPPRQLDTTARSKPRRPFPATTSARWGTGYAHRRRRCNRRYWRPPDVSALARFIFLGVRERIPAIYGEHHTAVVSSLLQKSFRRRFGYEGGEVLGRAPSSNCGVEGLLTRSPPPP